MEMLVAVALGAVILAVVVTAFTQGSVVSEMANAQTESMHNARVAMDLLERDMKSAYIEPAGPVFWGQDSSLSGASATELRLRTVSRTDGPAAQEVYYTIEARDVGVVKDVPSLVRGHSVPGGDPSDRTYPVGQIVRVFKLRFYSDESKQWYARWDSTQSSRSYQYRRLPDVVEVTLEVVDLEENLAREGNNRFILRRLIRAPDNE